MFASIGPAGPLDAALDKNMLDDPIRRAGPIASIAAGGMRTIAKIP